MANRTTTTGPNTCPLPRGKVVELYFLENRAKLLDIAAFLDRLDRAQEDGSDAADFRVTALLGGIDILRDGDGDRARRIQEALSDHTTAPLDSAAGLKGAFGAFPGEAGAS